jgi:microcystin-dependent protein
MPGTPPSSPNFGVPRYSDGDTASFSVQVNGVTDVFDANAVKNGATVLHQPGDLIVSAASSRAGCLLCDGSAVARAGTYAALWSAIGTTYGAGDGTSTFNLPDCRGRALFGAGLGGGLTTRPVGQYGGGTLDISTPKKGEETHTLNVNELPSHIHADSGHNHGISDSGHSHTITDPGHYHPTIITQHNVTSPGGSIPLLADVWNNPQTGHTPGVYANSWGTVSNMSTNSATTGITAQTAPANITLSPGQANIQPTGSGVAHNNLPPFIAVNVFIKY